MCNDLLSIIACLEAINTKRYFVYKLLYVTSLIGPGLQTELITTLLTLMAALLYTCPGPYIVRGFGA